MTPNRLTNGQPVGRRTDALGPCVLRYLLLYFTALSPAIGRLHSTTDQAAATGFRDGPYHPAHYLQVEVLILEVRYMDDYFSVWKGPTNLPVDRAKAINDILRDQAYQRYPLPLKRDDGQKFMEIEIHLNRFGPISTAPSLLDLPPYGHLRHPPLTHFSSFVPMSMKKTGFIGLMHRIDAYTYPYERKAAVLHEASRIFSDWHRFLVLLLKRWAAKLSHTLTLSWIAL